MEVRTERVRTLLQLCGLLVAFSAVASSNASGPLLATRALLRQSRDRLAKRSANGESLVFTGLFIAVCSAVVARAFYCL